MYFDKVFYDIEAIESRLAELEYPLYFLDYETYPAAIPVFDGCYPFQQVPFQYSLHVQKDSSAPIEHKEFLHIDDSNPIMNLTHQLRKDMGNIGSVIVWNKSFEGKCNSDMAEQVPELSDFLLGINTRFFDLEEVFKKQMYVDKGFLGRTSIKNVLPILVPNLTYKGSSYSKWRCCLQLMETNDFQ